MNNREKQAALSARLFRHRVWPIIRDWVDFDCIHSVESDSGLVCNHLDMLAGFDAYGITDKGISGIASRCQYVNNYKSFTIRCSLARGGYTEAHKRMHALYVDKSTPSPKWTVQAYFDTEDYESLIASVGLVHTKDLFDWVLKYEPGELVAPGGNKFWPVPWTHGVSAYYTGSPPALRHDMPPLVATCDSMRYVDYTNTDEYKAARKLLRSKPIVRYQMIFGFDKAGTGRDTVTKHDGWADA